MCIRDRLRRALRKIRRQLRQRGARALAEGLPDVADGPAGVGDVRLSRGGSPDQECGIGAAAHRLPRRFRRSAIWSKLA
eukprot:13742142-Alexandrium_andersonii.AAC.1